MNDTATMPLPMLKLLAQNWWMLLLRGLCAIAFGVMALAWPGITLLSLILIYGVYSAADGMLSIIAAIRGGAQAPRGWLVVAGIAALAVAAVCFLAPGLTALALLYLIAAWAVVRGMFEIVAAIRLRKEIDNEWLLILAGAVSVLFGVCIALWPGASAITLVWFIGAWAIVVGVMCVVLAFKLKKRAGT